jgi:hypothetical protein
MTQQGFQSSPAGATHIRRQSQRIVFPRNRSGATSLHGALAEHHQDLDKFSRCSEIKLRASSESQNCRNIYASLFFLSISLSLSLLERAWFHQGWSRCRCLRSWSARCSRKSSRLSMCSFLTGTVPALWTSHTTEAALWTHVAFDCSLLLRRECCSFSNGEYVKAGLDELEHWCFWLTEEVMTSSDYFNRASVDKRSCLTSIPFSSSSSSSSFFDFESRWPCNCEQYAGSAWDELKHIRQAVTLLILDDKHSRSLAEITDDFCPVSFLSLASYCTLLLKFRFDTAAILVKLVTASSIYGADVGAEHAATVPDQHDVLRRQVWDPGHSIRSEW